MTLDNDRDGMDKTYRRLIGYEGCPGPDRL